MQVRLWLEFLRDVACKISIDCREYWFYTQLVRIFYRVIESYAKTQDYGISDYTVTSIYQNELLPLRN